MIVTQQGRHLSLESELLTVRLENLEVSRTPCAKSEVFADPHATSAQAVDQDVPDECLWGLRSESRIEVLNDDVQLGADAFDQLDLAGHRSQTGGGGSTDGDGGMGLERQGDRDELLGAGFGCGVGQDRLVPEVDAVEVTDGDEGGTLEVFHAGAYVFRGAHGKSWELGRRRVVEDLHSLVVGGQIVKSYRPEETPCVVLSSRCRLFFNSEPERATSVSGVPLARRREVARSVRNVLEPGRGSRTGRRRLRGWGPSSARSNERQTRV